MPGERPRSYRRGWKEGEVEGPRRPVCTSALFTTYLAVPVANCKSHSIKALGVDVQKHTDSATQPRREKRNLFPLCPLLRALEVILSVTCGKESLYTSARVEQVNFLIRTEVHTVFRRM